MTELGLPVLVPASPWADRRLAACVVTVVILHGMVLAWARSQPPEQASAQAPGNQGRAVAVRMVQAAMTGSSNAPAATEVATAEAAHPTMPEPRAAQARSEAGGEAAPSSPRDGDQAIDLTGYVPRRWLTVAPEPTAPVVLPFPAAFEDRARYSVVLSLYIEADGRVGRVEFEGVPLPDILERAARSTFENARFTPGEVAGRIVKSLIRVEVDFNNLGAS